MNTIIAFLAKLTLVFGVLLMVNDVIGQSDEDYRQEEYNDGYNDYDEGEKVSITEIDFHVSIPVNNFNQNFNGLLVGPGFGIYRQRKFGKPQFWGLRFKYNLMDRQNGRIDDIVDGQPVDIDRTVSSSIVEVKFAYRIYPKGDFWLFDPYVELGLGGALYYTSLSDRIVQFEDSANVDFINSDIGMIYGINLGSHLELTDNILLNMRIGYQSGTIATYDTETDTDFFDPLDNFELNTSSVETVNLMLGLSFPF